MIVKKKLILVFLIIAVGLLLVNISLDYLNGSDDPGQTELTQTTVKQIEKEFYSVLYNYGISNDWIKVRKISNEKYDSLKHVYFINVPADLPILLLINEFNQLTEYKDVNLVSIEKTNYGSSSFEVLVNDVTKLQANFIRSDKIKRNFVSFSFIVLSSDIESPDQLIRILRKFPIELNFLLRPNENSSKYINKLDSVKQQYSVLIDDDIDGDNFKLTADMSKEQLKRSIISIISTFGRQPAFIFDDQSAIYNSVVFNYVRDELSRRNVSFYLMSSLINLNSPNDDEVKSLFQFHCSSAKVGDYKIFLIDFEKLPGLYEDIMIEKKKGNRFLQPFN